MNLRFVLLQSSRILAGLALPVLLVSAGEPTVRLHVDAAAPGIPVSPTLHGLFFEDINYGADGGLYAELVQNRSFEHGDALYAWSEVNRGSGGRVSVESKDPLHGNNPHYLRVQTKEAGQGFGVVNGGYDGIAVRAGARYWWSVHTRTPATPVRLVAQLETPGGDVIGRAELTIRSRDWQRQEILLQAGATRSDARLAVLVVEPGTVDLDMVSLFPTQTFKGRRNGLRADLAQLLADMKPGFLRFPGGCIVEGSDLENAYRWKDTIGDVAERKQNANLWADRTSPQYYQSYGLGFFEFFQFCEDIGAEPVPVVNCGMACQARRGTHAPLDELEPWIQDALDLVEFANGPASSEWGAKRAAMGHPEPFDLKYLGVGNEQWLQDYFDRYPVFHRALKARYPNLQLISTSGPAAADSLWQFAWDQFRSGTPADIVDEHYYVAPEWLLDNVDRYATYDRQGPKIFVGEFAAHQPNRANSLRAAVTEGAYITGLWRHADVVTMSSYAPLLANIGHAQWRPDLIWFDNSRVQPTPSYHVQALAAQHRPDTVLPTTVQGPSVPPAPLTGRIGVGTWETQAEFKDIVVTRDGQELFRSDFSNNLEGWETLGGEWSVVGGALRQAGRDTNIRAFAGDPAWTDYTLSLKARKLSGSEGFLISFASTDAAAATWWNLGGWQNSEHGLELPNASVPRVRGRIETGRWYDIRVELQGAGVKCYLDGELLQESVPTARPVLFASAGRDRRSGDLVLAVANPTDQPAHSILDVAGASLTGAAQLVELTSASPDDVNTLDDPNRVTPTQRRIQVGRDTLERTFPAWSFTILRLETHEPQSSSAGVNGPAFWDWARKPPMGWNSWDSFATTVTESQTRAQADFMAQHLKPHGWEYVVVDIQWYEPRATGYDYRRDAELTLDEWGRLWPATNRFPSAANGVGFKALSDAVHRQGLKFGVHLMRGIPRQAVRENTAVKGTSYHARDIANTNSVCTWNGDMYGVDMTKPGAQAYYDSVFALLASWGVDYVKVDDISRPYHDNEGEIEAVRLAIDRSRRPMVLSLSPGETALTAADHVSHHANLWRISDDFWDSWPALYEQFERLNHWNPHRGPGHWPDADMLPLGVLDMGRRSTRFTPDEQITVMTLWSIARSPLMHGGDLSKTDPFTLSLLTNDEVLSVNQNSTGNQPLFQRGDFIGWVADVPESQDRYLALFNAPKAPQLLAENAVFRSPQVSRRTSGQGVKVDVDITGARKLFLVATDGGDGIFADHVDWIEPRLDGVDGEARLTDLRWTEARTGYGRVGLRVGAEGQGLRVAGTHYADGIGAHAESVIEYDLPEGVTRFRAFAALDDAGTRLRGGATVRFYVFTNAPFAPELTAPVPVTLAELGFQGTVQIRDLWQQQDLGVFRDTFAPEINPHGAGLYRVSPTQRVYPDPLVEQRADPWVWKHTDGFYYFIATVPEYDRIEIRRAATLAGLGDAAAQVVWRKHDQGPMSWHVWAPELHPIDGKWYIYFAASRADAIWDIRVYVLENASADPFEGAWVEKGQLDTGWESFALDATTFEHRGRRYLVWAQKDPRIRGNTNLYLAEMANPWTLKGDAVLITRPEYAWEQIGFWVNEGPAVLNRNGRFFLTYSASATDHHYCVGLLTADEDADLLDPQSWHKSPTPVFVSSPTNGQYGPGHSCFTLAEDGKTDLLIYHARSYRDIEGDPLNNPDRHTRVQQLHWQSNGAPDFRAPGADRR